MEVVVSFYPFGVNISENLKMQMYFETIGNTKVISDDASYKLVTFLRLAPLLMAFAAQPPIFPTIFLKPSLLFIVFPQNTEKVSAEQA